MKTILASFIVLALVACGSSKEAKDSTPSDPTNPADPNTPQEQDPTTPSTEGPDGSSVDAGPKAPSNQAECIVACEGQHPTSAKLNHTLDTTCLLGGACEPVCNGLGTGKLFQPTVDEDAGVQCDTAKANSYPITTPSAACSTCLANTPACCTLWISIFSSVDGQALNTCSNKCYVDFSK